MLRMSATEEYNWYNNYYNRWEAARDQRDALEEQIPTADYIRIQQLNFELNQMTLDDAEEVYNNLPSNIYAEHGRHRHRGRRHRLWSRRQGDHRRGGGYLRDRYGGIQHRPV